MTRDFLDKQSRATRQAAAMTWISDALKKYQSQRRLKTQAQLADHLGYSKSTFGRWYNGDTLPDVHELEELASKMGGNIAHAFMSSHEIMKEGNKLLLQRNRELAKALLKIRNDAHRAYVENAAGVIDALNKDEEDPPDALGGMKVADDEPTKG